MSAGGGLPAHLREYRELDCLAPKFREAVEASLAECHARGLDAIVWETCRSQELQEFYYLRGRPPTPEYPKPVTGTKNAMKAWHFYGLAVDVISRRMRWKAGEAWFAQVAEIFKAHGCDWGGDWVREDLPHFQWGVCRASPSQISIDTFTRAGRSAVWQLVRAA